MNFLITSAAYVNSEMVAEIGLIPPAFLPLGTSRLVNYQIDSIKRLKGIEIERIVLSLPKSFTPDAADRARLEAAAVEIVYVPDGLTLGSSINFCLTELGLNGPMAILHGDTLVTDDVLGAALAAENGNACVVAPAPGNYSWGRAFVKDGRFWGALADVRQEHDLDVGPCKVLVGLFLFRDAAFFRDALRYSNADFVTALSRLAFLEEVHAVQCRSWTDFGHLQTYYTSRVTFASARQFNDIQIANGVVRKSGSQNEKIRFEAQWYEALPAHLKQYSARLIDSHALPDNRWQYETEYEYLPTLQELFVFGRLADGTWDEILSACCKCLDDFAAIPVPDAANDALSQLTKAKTWERLEQFEAESGFDMSVEGRVNGHAVPSPRKIAEEMMSLIDSSAARAPTVMHGDFCFSNTMFNARTQRIRLIDPRGTLDGKSFSLGGDSRYDMAKLAHSVIGLYDLIIVGNVACRRLSAMEFNIAFSTTDSNVQLASRFSGFEAAGHKFGDSVIQATMILLFLSMLPLHADRPDRQDAFVANALRLYEKIF
ncbi:hypothetical protein [Xanthobacter agilis]|uniref:hypothetical protein n=1 Tax=Xanthobacter agilis TaxID=47492 RepID=UPI003727C484